MKTPKYSQRAIQLSGLLVLVIFLLYPKWSFRNTSATISWDVSGYYLYLPAIFIYEDLAQLDFAKPLIKEYGATSGYYQSKELDNGNQFIKYPAGWALLNTPFFLIGHGYAKMSNYPADGLSKPYQVAIAYGGLLIAFLGLFFLRKVLLRYFEDRVVAVTILLLIFGTNYLHYITADVALTHNYLFTGYSLVLLLTDNWHRKQNWKTALGLGMVLGLMTLMRPTEFLAILIPIFWPYGINWKAKRDLLLQHWRQMVLLAFTMFLIGVIQFGYWKFSTGSWLFYSYEEGFDFLSPHIKKVLFSFRKGWFVYTPLMLFSMLGFYFLYRKHPRLFPAIGIFFLINFYIVASWQCWWYGGSFSQRALVQSYAVLAFPLAAFLTWVLDRKIRVGIFALPLLFFVALNLFQTWQIRGNGLHPESMTKAYYWRTFFNPNITPWDKFRMDTKEDFLGKRFSIHRVYEEGFERLADSLPFEEDITKAGDFAIFASGKQRISQQISISKAAFQAVDGDWLRVGGWFYAPWREWNPGQMAQLELCFRETYRGIHYRIIRPQRVMHAKDWTEVWMDTPIPEADFDAVEIRLLQPNGRGKLILDNLYIEVYSSKENH